MLTIFANYPAEVVDGEIHLELNHSFLSDDLIDQSLPVSYAATIPKDRQAGGGARLTNIKVGFCLLGAIGTRNSGIAKAYEYFKIIPNILGVVSRSRFCYIFTPGHVGLLAALCCLILRRPYGLYLRGDWKIGTPKFIHFFQPYLFGRAVFILCTGEDLAKKTGAVNPNCAPVVPMSSILTQQDGGLRRIYRRNASRILFVGQVIRGKGVYELVEALAQLKKNYQIIAELSIVGSGADLEELQNLAAVAGVASQVKFLGVVADPKALADIYQSQDVFCLPTMYPEGFPRVLYEAMTCGMPIVTTRVGQIGTLLSHNRNALFVDARNPSMLATRLSEILQDAALRKRLGLEARATVEPFLRNWRASSHGRQVALRLKQLKIDLS